MDEILVTALESDVVLSALFDSRQTETPWLYSSSSVGIGENPEIPEFPYVVYNELPSAPYQEVRKISHSQQRLFTFYVYDEMGDYARINTVLQEIRRILKDLAPFEIKPNAEYPAGLRCSDVRWDGISSRIVDDGHHAGVRFGTARITVSE